MSQFATFFKYITPTPNTTSMQSNQDMTGSTGFSNSTWFHTLVHGSTQRIVKYREYDMMDQDVDVSRALDTIAEEMTGNNPRTSMPLELDIQVDDDTTEDKVVLTLKVALKYWCSLHDWETRIFNIARNTIKYGDVFFQRGKKHTDKWAYINPKLVVAALVDSNDATKVLGWQVQTTAKKAKSEGGYQSLAEESDIVPAEDIVRFTTSDDMSDHAPFGESVLQSVYKSHKQKELLETAILIYRISRAPERRVFHIDTGGMHPARRKKYLDEVKNDIRQKKIPTNVDGESTVESTYNPQSISEDYFFAVGANGKGSRVETLPGGGGLGVLDDLDYFANKTLNGLRIPQSYMQQGSGGAVFNDGKVGVAYIQERNFAVHVMRLQGHIEKVMDVEFKQYLRASGIHIDEFIYKLRLPSPSNFGTYRQAEMDATLLAAFSQADAIPYTSKRFILKRYLQWSDEDLIENEAMLRDERGITEGEKDDVRKMYEPDMLNDAPPDASPSGESDLSDTP